MQRDAPLGCIHRASSRSPCSSHAYVDVSVSVNDELSFVTNVTSLGVYYIFKKMVGKIKSDRKYADDMIRSKSMLKIEK